MKKLNSERNKRLEKFWRGARYLQRHRTKVATIRNFPRKPRSNSSKIFSIAPNHLLLDPLRDITPSPSFHFFFQKRRKHSVESSPFTNSLSLPPDSILEQKLRLTLPIPNRRWSNTSRVEHRIDRGRGGSDMSLGQADNRERIYKGGTKNVHRQICQRWSSMANP